MKVHLFDFNHYSNFLEWNKDKNNATKCGYVRKFITDAEEEVTCKLCLRLINTQQK